MPEQVSDFLSFSVGSLTAGRLLQAAAALLVCVALGRIVVKHLGKVLGRWRVERSLHTFLKSALRVVIYTITALIVADSLGIPVTSLVALLGVAGIAISLSVQNTLMNLMGGLLVLSTKPFIVGDYIAASDAEGTVVDIGLIYTQIATVDDKIVFLPNGSVASAKITNFTRSRKRRLDMTFSATPDSDPEAVKALILGALSDERVIADPPPLVRVAGYTESGVQYVMRAWVATCDYWNLFYDLNERVGRAFRDEGVRMPGRQIEINVRDQAPKP